MTIDDVLVLVSSYGLSFLALVTCLSCLALPLPVSIAMMLSGSFVAAGEFELWQVVLTAYLAAICGDQIGFWIGRFAGGPVLRWFSSQPGRQAVVAKARIMLDEKGWWAVFLSRWLFSPLGPYINFTAGAAAMHWMKFSLPSVLGEAVWVTLYVGLGYVFSANVSAVAELAGNASGFLAAGTIALFLGWRLWVAVRASNKQAQSV